MTLSSTVICPKPDPTTSPPKIQHSLLNSMSTCSSVRGVWLPLSPPYSFFSFLLNPFLSPPLLTLQVSLKSLTPSLSILFLIPLDSISHLASVPLKSTLSLLLLKFTHIIMAWPQLTAVAPLYSLCTDLDCGFEDQALRKLRLSKCFPALSRPLTAFFLSPSDHLNQNSLPPTCTALPVPGKSQAARFPRLVSNPGGSPSQLCPPS